MKLKIGTLSTLMGALSLASSLLIAACGPASGGGVAMKDNAPRRAIGERALKSFSDYKSDAKLTDSLLGASAETVASSGMSTGANAADVSVRLVLRGSGGELVTLHGTAAAVLPKERRLLTLDAACANPKYEIEVACQMEYCGTLAVRLIEKADPSMESMAATKIGPQRPDAHLYRQAGIVFAREGVNEELIQQRRANRQAVKKAAADGSEGPVTFDPKLKITAGPMKRLRTDRAGGQSAPETSFEAAVESLRASKENISLVNACVDQATAEPAPAEGASGTVTGIQPVEANPAGGN